MASEVRSFQVTIPAGTAQAAGFSASLAMPDRQVERIEIKVPPGPRGVMGFAIGSSGQPVIPLQLGQFIVTDNEEIVWDLERQIDSGAWQLFGYNIGQFPHTIYLRFLVNPPGQGSASGLPAPLTATQLASI